jgi:signal transduction histidine kinase/CheY-like chemotaxis protein
MIDTETDNKISINKDMTSNFKELQQNTILLTLPGLFIAGLLLGALASYTQDFIWALNLGLGLMTLIPIIWWVNRKSFLLASLLFILGSLAAVWVIVLKGNIYPALFLLVLPVGYTSLTLGAAAGAAAAAVCTALIWLAPGELQNIGDDLRVVTILGIWGTTGVIWLTLRPLLTAAEWSWQAFQRSSELLAKAQDYQVKLQQAIEDLTNANTQLNRLNILANNLRQEAEDERRTKQQFVANVSHELRTPLNMIIGFSEMILKAPDAYGSRIPTTLLADLQVVLRNSQHLSSLIDDVLDLSQIEAGQMALVKEWVNVTDVIQAATVAVRPLYESKKLHLELQIEEGLPQVYCDRTRIREVLLNLLSNAGRFTEEGGVEVRAWRESGGVSFSVKSRLFQPFQQLDATIRRRHGGTGLGLNISKSFVEMHNGKMWVESQPGQGTTFFFRLPVEPVAFTQAGFARWVNPFAVHEIQQRLAALPLVDSRPHFLVVERGHVLQRLLKRYLANIEISVVPDLNAARLALDETPAHAVLFNEAHESDAAGLLKANLPNQIPAIIFSIADPLQFVPAGNIPEVLVKPVTQDALLEAIDRLNEPVKTILVVDDELDAQKLFLRMLTSANRGYQVLRASHGLQALNLVRREKVSLILLDLIMPEMDGYEFLKVKAADPNLCDIPVILVSAQDLRGAPVVSNYLAVTRGGGLSVRQILDFIQSFVAIMASSNPHTGSANPGAVRD